MSEPITSAAEALQPAIEAQISALEAKAAETLWTGTPLLKGLIEMVRHVLSTRLSEPEQGGGDNCPEHGWQTEPCCMLHNDPWAQVGYLRERLEQKQREYEDARTAASRLARKIAATPQPPTASVVDREAVARIVRVAMQEEFVRGSRWEADKGRVAHREAEANRATDAILALTARAEPESVSSATYENAVKGRQDFRKAYRDLLPVQRAAEALAVLWRTPGVILNSDEFLNAVNAVDVAITGGGKTSTLPPHIAAMREQAIAARAEPHADEVREARPPLPKGTSLFAVNCRTDEWFYINHAKTWQPMPNPILQCSCGEVCGEDPHCALHGRHTEWGREHAHLDGALSPALSIEADDKGERA